jgi:hypothetical protein
MVGCPPRRMMIGCRRSCKTTFKEAKQKKSKTKCDLLCCARHVMFDHCINLGPGKSEIEHTKWGSTCNLSGLKSDRLTICILS